MQFESGVETILCSVFTLAFVTTATTAGKNNFVNDMCYKANINLGFYFSQILVAATLTSVLDCGDVLHMHVSSQSLYILYVLDTVYHGALSFVTHLKALTHHFLLYEHV